MQNTCVWTFPALLVNLLITGKATRNNLLVLKVVIQFSFAVALQSSSFLDFQNFQKSKKSACTILDFICSSGTARRVWRKWPILGTRQKWHHVFPTASFYSSSCFGGFELDGNQHTDRWDSRICSSITLPTVGSQLPREEEKVWMHQSAVQTIILAQEILKQWWPIVHNSLSKVRLKIMPYCNKLAMVLLCRKDLIPYPTPPYLRKWHSNLTNSQSTCCRCIQNRETKQHFHEVDYNKAGEGLIIGEPLLEYPKKLVGLGDMPWQSLCVFRKS